MSRIRTAGSALAVAAVAATLSACGTEVSDGAAPTSSPQPEFSDFDPCTDLPPDFVERRGLELLGGYESEKVVGDKPGRVCRYLNSSPGYALVIAATAAELGYPDLVYEEHYESVQIGGRNAERSGPQTGSEDVYDCRLLVDMAVGGLWFRFTRHGVLPGDPCADLTELATEVIGMLPPGS